MILKYLNPKRFRVLGFGFLGFRVLRCGVGGFRI